MAGVTQPKKKLLKEKTRVVAGTSSEPASLFDCKRDACGEGNVTTSRQKREPI
jgi:hypothetical protein